MATSVSAVKTKPGGSKSRNFKNSHQHRVLLLLSPGPMQAMPVSPGEQLSLGMCSSILGRVQIQHSPHHLHQEAGWPPHQHPCRDPGGSTPALYTLSPGKVSLMRRESKASSICESASLENPRVERNPIQPGGATDQISVSSFTGQPFPEHLLCVGPEPAPLAWILCSSLWLGPWQRGQRGRWHL